MAKITYKDAGVDVERGYEAVKRMRAYAEETFDEHVLTGLGSFGGLYDIGGGNVLVAGTDGVGTKLKAAFATGRHDTIGIDCVAMCVNDVVCQGARPLFFLDYIATGMLKPDVVAEIVRGVAEGCRQAGCALIGGETAEMPGFYAEGEYDVAGFAVGIVQKDRILDGKAIRPGDALIGLASSGVHSNGYSLVRRVIPMRQESLGQYIERLGQSLEDALLTPTKIYVKTVLDVVERFRIKGAAHITGGGFIENIPRMLPEGTGAAINTEAFPVPPILDMVVEDAGLSREDAFNTFNMGIGMVLAVHAQQAEAVIQYINGHTDDTAYCIGEVVSGSGVELR